MRVVVQRVGSASVTSEGKLLGSIGRGLLVLVGMAPGDDAAAVRWMAEKVLRLRIFEDDAGKMNRSVEEIGGGILVVSQFTLYGDAARGNRPSFAAAAPPDVAKPLYEMFVGTLASMAPLPVATGRFGAAMEVALVNDGPVTILLER
ncbi:MAG: D-aminoacyl-tRNA deacylase [Gemmatimonadota bacterium]